MIHPILTIAVQAAREAGNFIIKTYERKDTIKIVKKNKNDFVTNIDKKAEQIIIKVIHKYYPTHSLLTEESGTIIGEQNAVQWVIDPLNGISNFSRHLPHFSISIAVRINDRTEVSTIYNPILNELFTAVRGKGAQLNGYRLRLNLKNNNESKKEIIAMGFPFKEQQNSRKYINIITKILKKYANFRCTGSAALDLAYVASNRVDAFFEIGLKPWDFMAGELLVREAGGLITDLIGNHNYFFSGNLLAGSSRMVKEIAVQLKTEFRDPLKVH